MTLEEFQEFAEGQIQKLKAAKRKEWEEAGRRLSNKRIKGLQENFIEQEDGHWIAVKNGEIIERCDTEGEAWRALYA